MHLSGCGAVEPEVYQLQQWLALGEYDVAGFSPLECLGVGVAVLDGAGTQPQNEYRQWPTT